MRKLAVGLSALCVAVGLALAPLQEAFPAQPTQKTAVKKTARKGKAAAAKSRSSARKPAAKASSARSARSAKARASAKRARASRARSARVSEARRASRHLKSGKSVRRSAKSRGRSSTIRKARWHPRSAGVATNRVPRRRNDGSDAAARGLHLVRDPLSLRSSVVLATRAGNGATLFAKNAGERLPIASISKLMTALVVCEMDLPMDERLQVTGSDMIHSGVHSKLRLGDRVTRRTAMHLALMTSDNRAAELLARTSPEGYRGFIERMNVQAQLIGMRNARFQDACGLSRENQATAWDVAKLIDAAEAYPMIREFSTQNFSEERVGKRRLALRGTNRLLADPNWKIELQKTGYTTPAGRCVALQAWMGGEKVNLVILDAPATHTRAADANRVKNWVVAGARLDRRFWDKASPAIREE